MRRKHYEQGQGLISKKTVGLRRRGSRFNAKLH